MKKNYIFILETIIFNMIRAYEIFDILIEHHEIKNKKKTESARFNIYTLCFEKNKHYKRKKKHRFMTPENYKDLCVLHM